MDVARLAFFLSRWQQILLVTLLVTPPLTGFAQPRESIEGRHYQALASALPTETGADRIEVRELFWYGCPECAAVSPMMSDWRDGVTGDLIFIRTPVIWNQVMALHARIFYTARELGIEDTVHHAAFESIREGKPLNTETQILEMFTDLDVSQQDFISAWQSDNVDNAVNTARNATALYMPDKLPAVLVNGRYVVHMNQYVPNPTELNIAVNLIVRRLRDERRSDF